MSMINLILELIVFALAGFGGAYAGCIYGAHVVTGVLDRTIKETMDERDPRRAWAGTSGD